MTEPSRPTLEQADARAAASRFARPPTPDQEAEHDRLFAAAVAAGDHIRKQPPLPGSRLQAWIDHCMEHGDPDDCFQPIPRDFRPDLLASSSTAAPDLNTDPVAARAAYERRKAEQSDLAFTRAYFSQPSPNFDADAHALAEQDREDVLDRLPDLDVAEAALLPEYLVDWKLEDDAIVFTGRLKAGQTVADLEAFMLAKMPLAIGAIMPATGRRVVTNRTCTLTYTVQTTVLRSKQEEEAWWPDNAPYRKERV